jgi:hypothetical protein
MGVDYRVTYVPVRTHDETSVDDLHAGAPLMVEAFAGNKAVTIVT